MGKVSTLAVNIIDSFSETSAFPAGANQDRDRQVVGDERVYEKDGDDFVGVDSNISIFASEADLRDNRKY